MVPVQRDIVGHVGFPIGQAPLDDRMPATDDFEFRALHKGGSGVAMVLGQFRESEQEVQPRHGPGGGLEHGEVGVQCGHQRGERLPLHHVEPLFRIQDALLQFLELRRDVPLCLGQGLLPDPRFRDLVFVCVTDFEVVPENVVEGNLQGGDPGGLRFPFSDALELGFAIVPQVTQFIEFSDHTRGDGGAFAEHPRRVIGQLCTQSFQRGIGRIEPTSPPPDDGVVGAVHNKPQCFHCGQCPPQPFQFRGRNPDGCHFGQQTLQVSDAPEFSDEVCTHLRLVEEGGYGFMAPGDALGIAQRLRNPPPKHPGTHGGDRTVHDVHQCRAFRMCGDQQFEVPDGETVHGNVASPFNPAQGCDVRQTVVFRCAHIVQGGTGGNHGQWLALQSEPLQSLGSEVSFERFPREVALPDPIVQRESISREVE